MLLGLDEMLDDGSRELFQLLVHLLLLGERSIVLNVELELGLGATAK